MTAARWQLLMFAAAALAFVMAVLPHPPQLPGQPNDKVQHIIAFATLAALAHPAFPAKRAGAIVAGLAVYGALIELIQLYPPLHRDGDVRDWLADTAAAAIVLVGLRRLMPLQKR